MRENPDLQFNITMVTIILIFFFFFLQLVDFDRLLSHHDKKLADRLNNEYLHEEWDFGLEKLEADKSKFKEPPVICGQSRIQMVRKTSYQDF